MRQSPIQRLFIATTSSMLSVANPKLAHHVASAGETMPLTLCALGKIRDGMKSHPVGRKVLKERPLIQESLELFQNDRLKKLDKNTVGYQYYVFMNVKNEGFKASERDPVLYIADEELRYVMTRYRQVHDFYHVLSGLNTSVLEEIVVKMLESAQTKLPLTVLSSLFGPFALNSHERVILLDMISWALWNGYKSEKLLNVYVEDWIDKPLDDLRMAMNFDVIPPEKLQKILSRARELKTFP